MAVKEERQVLARIGFAQRWLDRARRQYADGNLARSALTLVLAGAEVRHALEAAGAPGRAHARRRSPMAFIVVTAALLSAFLLVSHWPGTPGSISSPVPSLLQLSSSSGALLEGMGGLTAASRSSPARSGGSRVITPHRAQAAQHITPMAAIDLAGRQPLSAGAMPVGIGSLHTSMSELIDLVLTAERALRQAPAGLSSP